MPTTQSVWEKKTARTIIKLPPLPKSHGKRVACIGNCGALVTHAMGECRKCRKARLRNGLKIIKKNGG